MYCDYCEEDWQLKYNKLLINFKNLDRYNDVLHLLFYKARTLRNEGKLTSEATIELVNAIEGVEQYEQQLHNSRKETYINN